MWIDIPGYEGKYQVSFKGEIRRICKTKPPRMLNPYTKGNDKHRHIKLESKVFKVHKLVALAFHGKPKKGQVAYHVNGVLHDDYASNIEYISRSELGKLTGSSSRRRPVIKIDSNGEIIDCYSSARECARCNFMSYQTVIDRCNGKVKSLYAPDGFVYTWDEDERVINKVIRKIKIDGGINNEDTFNN